MSDHIEGIIKVGTVNIAAHTISVAQVEAFVRLAGLIAALVYTLIQIYKAIKRKD